MEPKSLQKIGRANIMLASVTVIGLMLCGVAQAVPHPTTPAVFPPNSSPYGHSYAEWVTMKFQKDFSTVWDPEACSVDRIGQVELLQDNFGGTSVWECEVPIGTAFLVNVVSGFLMCPGDCGPGGAAPNGTPEEILAATHALIDGLPELGYILECEVDGVPVGDIWSYRAQSPVFYGVAVEGCALNVAAPDYLPPGPYGPAAADGFFIMVRPLPPGRHVIHFHAEIGTNLPELLFETDVTHNITVLSDGDGRDAAPFGVEPTTWGSIKGAFH